MQIVKITLRICHLLYQYYQEVHQAVSPLTVSENTFVKEVPTKTGYYSTNKDGKIENFVFTEKNEIAYICSFSEKSVIYLFRQF
jgi:hypothetical protein